MNQTSGVLNTDRNATVDRAAAIITELGAASSALDNGGVAGFDVLHGGNVGGTVIAAKKATNFIVKRI